MIQLRENDFIAGTPRPTQPASYVKRQRGHVVAEGDLARPGVQEIGQRPASVINGRVSLETGGKMPVRVGVMVEQIVGHALDDERRHLGAAWAIEVRHRVFFVSARERGKSCAYRVERRDRGGRRRR